GSRARTDAGPVATGGTVRDSRRSTRHPPRTTPPASLRLCCSPLLTAIGRACSNAGFALDAAHKEKKHMPEAKKLTPADVLKGGSPLALTATHEPIGSDRFQTAGFPEIADAIYKAPRTDGTTERAA